MKWKPRDVIAVLIIVGLFVLLSLGRDSVVTWSLLAVVLGYYGIDFTIRKVRREDK